MKPNIPWRVVVLALAATTLLSACFFEDDEEEAAPPAPPSGTVPPGALASSRAYTQFAATLQLSETGLPLDLGDWVAPTSETEAPESVAE